MHAEALSGGVAEFDEAIEAKVCPFLNELGEVALGEMRAAYEQLDAGNLDAIGEIAERLANAIEEKQANQERSSTDSAVHHNVAQEATPSSPSTQEVIFKELVAEVPQAQEILLLTQLEQPTEESEHPAITTDQTVLPKPIVEQPKKKAETNTHTAEAPTVLSETTELKRPTVNTLDTPQKTMDKVNTPYKPLVVAVADAAPENTSPSSIAAIPESQSSASDDNLMPLEAPVELSPQIVEVDNTDTNQQEALLLESEAADTYEELLALLDAELDEPVGIEASSAEATTHDLFDTESPTLDTTQQGFETFFADELQSQEVVELKTITEQANEQPLEETFIQLALYLSNNLPLNSETVAEPGTSPELSIEDKEIRILLQEIADLLPGNYDIPQNAHEKSPISLELTQKLLTLLHALGHEAPREALVNLVRLRGIMYLLETVQCLCILNNSNEHHEFFLAKNVSASATKTRHLSSILGNAVLRLLSLKTFALQR